MASSWGTHLETGYSEWLAAGVPTLRQAILRDWLLGTHLETGYSDFGVLVCHGEEERFGQGL